MSVISGTPAAGADERAWATLERLSALERSPCSGGERQAAELIAAELAARGARTRLEREQVYGTYWVPLGIACSSVTLAATLPPWPGALLAGVCAASVTTGTAQPEAHRLSTCA